MEQQYKTDSEIYAVLEREIIDLTLRPGCSLSENPLCTRFGAPRSLIRVVLQRLQENGLVKIVPYKGTTVTRLNRDIVDELIYERIAVEARVLRDFAPHCTPEHRALIRQRAAAYDELAKAETLDFNRLYEADTRLHETWFSAMGKMYLWRTLQNAHADYSRFRMLDTMTTGGLAEVIADHRNLMNAIERCDLAAFEPLVERHLYGGIRRLGSKLTEEYAAITNELKAVCRVFGKEHLREVDEHEFYARIAEVRRAAGDRAVLRAAHVFNENKRCAVETAALGNGDFERFLQLVSESGRSSWMYLQNVIPTGSTARQELAFALLLCGKLLGGRGAFRVHGGGFAGTVQAFVPEDMLAGFRAGIDSVLGAGSCRVLSIRREGGCMMEKM